MFKYVHHVHYVVHNRDAMVEYLEKNFGMKPTRLSESERKKEKEAQYEVDKTLVQFVEPLDPTTSQGKFLATHGPGIFHVAWGVDDIQKLAQDLAAKGSKTLYHRKPVPSGQVNQSPHGYQLFTIDPATSHGVFFSLEGRACQNSCCRTYTASLHRNYAGIRGLLR